MTAEEFLTPEEEQRIIKAIQIAEKNTSGEIRVHLESKNKEKPSLAYVGEVFHKLGMAKTKDRNGILFYVDVNHYIFTIIGDKGIHNSVPEGFWNQIKELVIEAFKQGRYAKGLEQGILQAGEKLKQYFPYQSDDINELSDEISKH